MTRRLTTKKSVALKPNLLQEVRELILTTRQGLARGVNAALVMLYWKVGERIRTDILTEKRAEYGKEILPTLSAKLVPDFGQGFSPRNLARMISFADTFRDEKIVATLSHPLSWRHFIEIVGSENALTDCIACYTDSHEPAVFA